MGYEINILKTENSRLSEVDFGNIPFGKIFSDHMFIADFFDNKWHNCRIIPFGNISIHPATSTLHYGQAVFEGMKAYKSIHNLPQLFRPQDNIRRMNKSAQRMAMTEIPEELFLKALNELVALEQDWIPTERGSSLYIRPLLFATEEYIGIKPAENFRFMIITCPVGRYYTRPVKVLMDDKYVRAFPGGVGIAKTIGNYAATLLPAKLAREKGYDQILWLDGKEFKYVQEIGTMNVFFIIDGKALTPSLESGTILDGITRDSTIQLLKQKGIPVEERDISVSELLDAHARGLLEDAFGTGTAATISHISDIGYRGKNITLPPVETRLISEQIKEELEDIKVSKSPDLFNWVYKVETGVLINNPG